MIYPTLFSGIVVKDIDLRKPQEEQVASVASVQRAEFRPDWSTLFDEELRFSDVRLYDVQANIELESPLEILYCLNNRECLAPRDRAKDRARFGGAGARAKIVSAEIAVSEQEADQARTPLMLSISSLSIEGGKISIRREDSSVDLDVSRGEARNLFVPFNNQSGSLELDVFVKSSSVTTEQGEALPLRVRVEWSPLEASAEGEPPKDTEGHRLDVTLFSKNLPLDLVATLFPEIFSASPLVSGSLSGKTVLQYVSGRGWKLKTS